LPDGIWQYNIKEIGAEALFCYCLGKLVFSKEQKYSLFSDMDKTQPIVLKREKTMLHFL
jgi:hypothetical protein